MSADTAAIEAAGRGAMPPDPPASEEQDTVAGLRVRVLACAVLTVPVVGLSVVPAWWFSGGEWFALALAAPVVTWGAWPLHAAALHHLRRGAATMDTLMSLGVLVPTVWSIHTVFAARPHHPAGATGVGTVWGGAAGHVLVQFAAVLTTAVLAGRLMEAGARRRSRTAMHETAGLGGDRRIPVEQVPVGACGAAAASRPVDRVCAWFVPSVLVLASAAGGFWFGAGAGSTAALATAVAVLTVACPCALVLATPTALLVGSGRAARLGIVVGSGSDAAAHVASVDVLQLRRAVDRTVRGNLLWAFGTSAVLLPAAAAGFLDPMVAMAATALSPVLVVGNSLRLRRFTPSC